MSWIVLIFAASLGIALGLTPLVSKLALRFDLVDRPTERKVHKEPIPRLGGVAIYLAFSIPFIAAVVYHARIPSCYTCDPTIAWLFGGASLAFLLGLLDDFRPIRPLIKFAVQAAAASVAYFGGLQLVSLELPWGATIALGWLSLPATVFWFLLVINAINLIDGLDGLAAGVSLFVAVVLLVLCVMNGNLPVTLALACLAGACLGFLRYNFNPASIFMGDGGSYFLGYMLASLSIMGSMESHATVAILIPIIALGLPLMDTLIAPIRRIILGKAPFQPDKQHIHHKLMQKGMTQRNAVLVMYSATVVLGLFALCIVSAGDERVAFILLLLGVCSFVFIRKLGYLDYLAMDKTVSYLKDVSDTMGFTKERRTFLNCQIAIDQSEDSEHMWREVIKTLQLLGIDHAEIQFNGVSFPTPPGKIHQWTAREIHDGEGCPKDAILSMTLPLSDDVFTYGSLYLEKDIRNDPVSHYTLKRIEHLRRAIVRKTRALEELVANRSAGAVADTVAIKETERRFKEGDVIPGSGRAKA